MNTILRDPVEYAYYRLRARLIADAKHKDALQAISELVDIIISQDRKLREAGLPCMTQGVKA